MRTRHEVEPLASDLCRTLRTATGIAASSGVRPVPHRRSRERSYALHAAAGSSA